MTQVFRLPDLGEGLTEAEIVHWLVAEGDEVEVDQDVVTVETAKAAVDVPCPYAGTVLSLHGAEGDEVQVGAPLISVTAGAEPAAEGAPTTGDEPVTGEEPAAGGEQYRDEERAGADPAAAPERPLVGYGAGAGPPRRSRKRGRAIPTTDAPLSAEPDPADPAPTAPASTAVKVISPLVRKLALGAGIDLSSLTPTGAAGVLTRADVEAAMTQVTPASASPAGTSTAGPGTRIPITGVHRLMVDRLSASRREIPDATTWVDVDATGLLELRDALKAARPVDRIGILALLARITVAGLRRYPALNSSVDMDAAEIVQHEQVNLGFAAQSPRGLVVPVVHGASTMTTSELATELHRLTDQAREGSLSPAELTGGTVTLNNYGVFGVDGSTPIINPPEVAMLGIGRIVDKPWVVDGQLAVRRVTQLSFTFDHRVCDGQTAGGFLRLVADCVESPATLLADL